MYYINKNWYYKINNSNIYTLIKQSRFLLLCFIAIYNINFSQTNLILNPSFEQLSSCPNFGFEIVKATNWDNASTVTPCQVILLHTCCTNPPQCSVPYFNGGSAGQYQWPKTGNGMVITQIYSQPPANPNFRTYAIGTLSQTLINGKTYCGKIYLNLANDSKYKVNQFGMYFDNGSVLGSQTTCSNVINVIPQIQNNTSVIIDDTLGWVKIEGTFISNGSENRVTIGNFKTDVQTTGIATNFPTSYAVAVYNIDDLSLIPIEIKANAGRDTSICVGDSINLGRPNEIGLECNWFNLGNATPFANTSNIWYKPTASGTVTLVQSMDNCMMSYDTVNIVVCNNTGIKDLSKNKKNFIVYPNPNNGKVFFTADNLGLDSYDIKMYDVTGKQVYSQHYADGIGVKSLLLNLPNGLYTIHLTNTESNATYIQKMVIQQ